MFSANEDLWDTAGLLLVDICLGSFRGVELVLLKGWKLGTGILEADAPFEGEEFCAMLVVMTLFPQERVSQSQVAIRYRKRIGLR